MADEQDAENGRWDVGAKDGAVYVERRGEDNEQVFSDRLQPEDARQLAALLTKFADKAASTDEGGASERDDSFGESGNDGEARSESGGEESEDSDDEDDSDDDDSDGKS